MKNYNGAISDGDKILKIRLLVLTQYRNVTDSKTDRQTDRHRRTAWAALMQHREAKALRL